MPWIKDYMDATVWVGTYPPPPTEKERAFQKAPPAYAPHDDTECKASQPSAPPAYAPHKDTEVLLKYLAEVPDEKCDDEKDECTICMDAKANVTPKCGHTICASCARLLVETSKPCPRCNQEFEMFIRLHL